jgi:general secretion pathway protein L
MLRDAGKWWLGELTSLLPPAAAKLLVSAGRRLVIDLRDNAVVLGEWREGSWRELGRFERAGIDPAAVRAKAAGLTADLADADAVVRLPAGQALRKTLELPAAAEPDLRAILAYQIDRQTPFRPEQVYFDYIVRGRDAAGQKIRVEWVLIPRAVVDGALALARAWGIQPHAVDVAGADGADFTGLNLAPAEARPRPARTRRLAALGLAGAAAALLAAAIVLPIYLRGAALEETRQRVDGLKAGAESALALRREIDRLRSESEFLATKKKQVPSALAALAQLTKIVPDDAWLSEFHLAENEVRISGTAASASGLITAIEQSGVFRKASFRSPVTKAATGDTERFNLSFEIVAEGAK